MVAEERINGLLVPLITPFNSDLSIDFFGLKALTARLMNKGAKNFFLFSPMSESSSFSERDRAEYLSTVRRNVGQKTRLFVGCFADSAAEIVERVNSVRRFTDLCVVNLPLSSLENEVSFMDFFEELFNQTKGKVLLYNNPFLFKRNIPMAGVEKILGWERLLGVIDASRNPDYFSMLVRYKQTLSILQEPEELLFDSLAAGCSGLAPLLSNAFPSFFIDRMNDSRELSSHEALHRQARLDLVLKEFFPMQKRLQLCKHFLANERVIQPFHSKDFEPLTEAEKGKLSEFAKAEFA